MSAEIKISADTTEVKKSILDLAKGLKDIKVSKVSIFTESDKKFIKTEMKAEMTAMKKRINDNRDAIKKMVGEQQNLVRGSQEELEIRKKIVEAYKIQSKLGEELGKTTAASKNIPGGGAGGIGGMMGNLMGMLPKLLGGLALGVGAFAITKGVQATGQYVDTTPKRNRLKGLGEGSDNFGTADQLARVGLSESEMIDRRISAQSVLGRQGTDNNTEMMKASFERAFGLQGGAMTNVATALKPQMGGAEATQTQMKLQASILSSGIEDAIGPYLETMTSLLTSINENGTTNTSDLINLMSQLTKDGNRTPEQMAKAFQGINSAVMGSTGEANAFLQTAFASGGIGGGTLGGTKYALSSGGIFGMNRQELANRGYNKDLLDNMEKDGQFSGVGSRTNAIMNQFKQAGGLGAGDTVGGIKDPNKMYAMGNLANSVFKTTGNQGFDALKMLEQVQNKQMSPQAFDEQIKKMQEGNDPSIQRLDKINASLSGQTELLTNINSTLMQAFGAEGAVTRNAYTGVENEGIKNATGLNKAVNSTGIVGGAGKLGVGAIQKANTFIGDGLDYYMNGEDDKNMAAQAPAEIEKKRAALRARAHSNGTQTAAEQGGLTEKGIGKEVAKALQETMPNFINNNTVNVHAPENPDRTHP